MSMRVTMKILPKTGTRNGEIRFGRGWKVKYEVDALHTLEEGKGYTETPVVGYRVRIMVYHNSTLVHKIEDVCNVMVYSIESHKTKMKKIDVREYLKALKTALEIYKFVKEADRKAGEGWIYWTGWRETEELARLLSDFESVESEVRENVRPAFT